MAEENQENTGNQQEQNQTEQNSKTSSQQTQGERKKIVWWKAILGFGAVIGGIVLFFLLPEPYKLAASIGLISSGFALLFNMKVGWAVVVILFPTIIALIVSMVPTPGSSGLIIVGAALVITVSVGAPLSLGFSSADTIKIAIFTSFATAIVIISGMFLGALGLGIGLLASLIFLSMLVPAIGIELPKEWGVKAKTIMQIASIVFGGIIGASVGWSFYGGTANPFYGGVIGFAIAFIYYSLVNYLCYKENKETGASQFKWGMFALINIGALVALIIFSTMGGSQALTAGVGFNFPTMQFQLIKASQKYWEFTQLLTNPDYNEYQSLVGAEYEEEEISTGAPITKVFDIYLFEVTPKEAKEETGRYATISIENYLDRDLNLSTYIEIPKLEERVINFTGFSWNISACANGKVTYGSCPNSSEPISKIIPKGGQDIIQCSGLKLSFRKGISEDVKKVKCYIEAIVKGKFNASAIYPITFMNKDLYEIILTQGNFKQYLEKPKATVSRGPLEIRVDLKENQPIILDIENDRNVDVQIGYGKVGGGQLSKEGFFAKIPILAIFVPKILGTCQNTDFKCFDLDEKTSTPDLNCKNLDEGRFEGECNMVKSEYEKIKDDYYVCIKTNVQEFKIQHCILSLNTDAIKNIFGCNDNGCNRELATYYIGVYVPNYEYAVAKDAEIISTR